MGWNDGASLDPLTYVQPLQQASCLVLDSDRLLICSIVGHILSTLLTKYKKIVPMKRGKTGFFVPIIRVKMAFRPNIGG